MKKTLIFSLIALSAITYWACSKDAAIAHQRANDPWVFRSVLDKTPRMITIALDKEMWAAYRTDSCSLYKVWRGGVNFDGTVYNTHHGPQPTSVGDAFTINNHKRPWVITQNGQETEVAPFYRGHKFEQGGVSLMYELPLADGKRIKVDEHPEFVVDKSGTEGYERVFTTSDIPSGVSVALKTNVNSIVAKSNIVTEGGVFNSTSEEKRKVGDIEILNIEGRLNLMSNGVTKMTTFFVRNPTLENKEDDALFAKEEEGSSKAHPGEKLIENSDCQTCHNLAKQTVGPSYEAIAKKYPNTPENVAMLTKKVQLGGSGAWGQAAMSPHPTVAVEDIKKMVEYVMSLDKASEVATAASTPSNTIFKEAAKGIDDKTVSSGLSVKAYTYKRSLQVLPKIASTDKPVFQGVMDKFDFTDSDFKAMPDNTCLVAEGYLNIPKDNNYVFRIGSDDGSRLFVDGNILCDNDGAHGTTYKDGEIALKAGLHPVRLEYFQGGGGKNLFFQYAVHGGEFAPAAGTLLQHKSIENETAAFGATIAMPGDGATLADVHPSLDLAQARPNDFTPKVGGMDFLPDGRLVVSTWDPAGSVFIIENAQCGDPNKMKSKLFANGLAEPLGVKVVDGVVYVLQKQELTALIDNNKDGVADEYRVVANGWRASANFHEFAFGLVYKDGFFYCTLATAINPGGASTRPQIPDRGKVVKINKATGEIEFIARGLRTPNGIGLGVDNEIFVADNQGDWLPSSKILHIKQGAFYNSYSVDSINTWNLPVQQPVVWLPQDDIGNSPSQPGLLTNEGIYNGQMIHGEVTHGGLKRVFVEKVNGDYQGCVFEFTQGLEAGVNRIVRGPDGALYVGCIGNPGNWGQTGKQWFGLQRLKFNGKSTFEMLAIRAKTNGVEIELTEPLALNQGWNAADYQVEQWWYKPTKEYGGPKMDLERLPIVSSSVSADRKKIFLELKGMKPQHVLHVKTPHFVSAENHDMWAVEGWYTLNNIPTADAGTVIAHAPQADNTLSADEIAAGWQLLFDGKGLTGWHNFRKTTVGKSWIVNDNSLHLNAIKDPKGGWQAPDGGDIVTDKEYENYELSLDWKIDRCGNSGVIYNVVEDDKHEYVWQTGPEMQVLDNACHPDAKIEKHRAGDLYDLISTKYVTVKPSGQWNKAILRIQNGHLEHWLNGVKVVETTMWDDAWKKRIAESKFKDMVGFGMAKKGKISLQDHGNKVWYRNVKIRELK